MEVVQNMLGNNGEVLDVHGCGEGDLDGGDAKRVELREGGMWSAEGMLR